MNTLKIALLTLALAAFVRSESSECLLSCPDVFHPTCATDGDVFAKFDNLCALNVFNCKRQSADLAAYTEVDIDWCTTTELNELDEEMKTDLENADTSCLKICPMIFSPICASNGTFRKYFSNECEMNVFNCIYKLKNLKEWRVLKQGKCSINGGYEW